MKATFNNGRTMTAGFYNGLRLTNRQAQIAEMLRNGTTLDAIAKALGIAYGTVSITMVRAAKANGLHGVVALWKRLDIVPVRKNARKAPAEAPKAPKAPPVKTIGRATVRVSRLTEDQQLVQLALRFNGDVDNAARWLDWTVKECLSHIVAACTFAGVAPTVPNFLNLR